MQTERREEASHDRTHEQHKFPSSLFTFLSATTAFVSPVSTPPLALSALAQPLADRRRLAARDGLLLLPASSPAAVRGWPPSTSPSWLILLLLPAAVRGPPPLWSQLSPPPPSAQLSPPPPSSIQQLCSGFWATGLQRGWRISLVTELGRVCSGFWATMRLSSSASSRSWDASPPRTAAPQLIFGLPLPGGQRC